MFTIHRNIVISSQVVSGSVASEGDHSRGGAKGDAPGRVREGGTPPAQLGGMGERCELPHRGLGRSPRSQRFLRLKNSKSYAKTRRPRKRPRYMYTKPTTKKKWLMFKRAYRRNH